MTEPRRSPGRTLRRVGVSSRLGAIGGFVFIALIVAQNVLRGAINLPNDASAAHVVRDYADHRAVHWVLAVLFVAGAFGIATFVATLWNRLRDGDGAMPMRIGVLGVTGIVALFSTMVAIDVALTSYVHLGRPSLDVARGLWVLHNGVFSILMLPIAIALVGLALAAVGGGLIGPRWRMVGCVGAGFLVLSPLAAPAVTEGSAVLAISGIGFLLWIATILRISAALWRDAG